MPLTTEGYLSRNHEVLHFVPGQLKHRSLACQTGGHGFLSRHALGFLLLLSIISFHRLKILPNKVSEGCTSLLMMRELKMDSLLCCLGKKEA